jgi:hypothetical protein
MPASETPARLDLSDVDPRVGQPVGGGQLREPCWAGNEGYIRHSKNQFRGPAFEGDVSYLEGEVAAKTEQSPFGMPTVTIQVKMTNQDGGELADATLEVELPC